jgi:hypothetical protein
MVRPYPEPSHGQVTDYLTGKASGRDKAVIEWFQKNDRVWALFIKTMDGLRLRAAMSGRMPERTDAPSIPGRREIESLFENLCAGTLGRVQARRIVSALLSSPVFFGRWMHLLSEVEPENVLSPIQGMASVRMQNDGVLFAGLKSLKTGRKIPFHRRMADRLAGWTGIPGRAAELITGLSRSAKWAAAFSAVIVVASIAFYLRHSVPSGGIANTYVYDDRVPLEYDAEAYRGGPAAGSHSPEFEAWTSSIELGISNYLLCDYKSAIMNFEKAGRRRPGHPGGPVSMEAEGWERDLFLYQGLSHLALWRTRLERMDENLRSIHADRSLRLLAAADSVARSYGLKTDGREAYFIGLVYSLSHRRREAAGWMEKIRPDSPYYRKAALLLKGGK